MVLGDPGTGKSALLQAICSKWIPNPNFTQTSDLAPSSPKEGTPDASYNKDDSQNSEQEQISSEQQTHSSHQSSHHSSDHADSDLAEVVVKPREGFKVESFLLPNTSLSPFLTPTKNRKGRTTSNSNSNNPTPNANADIESHIGVTVYDWWHLPCETYVRSLRGSI